MSDLPSHFLPLELSVPIWDRFFTVSSLVIIGTRDEKRDDDYFATHRGFALGPANLFAFLAAAEVAAVTNSIRQGSFSVSLLRPDQVVEASLAAAEGSTRHPLLAEISTFPATRVAAGLVLGSQAFLECELDRVVEDLDGSSLVIGRIVAAFVDRDSRRVSERDDHDLIANHPLLAFVAPGRVASIDQTDTFPAVEPAGGA